MRSATETHAHTQNPAAVAPICSINARCRSVECSGRKARSFVSRSTDLPKWPLASRPQMPSKLTSPREYAVRVSRSTAQSAKNKQPAVLTPNLLICHSGRSQTGHKHPQSPQARVTLVEPHLRAFEAALLPSTASKQLHICAEQSIPPAARVDPSATWRSRFAEEGGKRR